MQHAINYQEINVKLDENGLFLYPESWNESSALFIANENGIEELTDAHWKVIYALRQHYEKFGVAPSMHSICRSNNKDPDWVHNLFQTCLNAWRISGLPDPGEEAKTYLSGM